MTLVLAALLLAQNHPPFWEDVQKFVQEDAKHPPAPGSILFVGSSSFTRWTDVSAAFPDRKILNRAFGGSTLQDQIRYEKEIVGPCSPVQIVIYCGENDLAGDAKLKPQEAAGRFVTWFKDVRAMKPGVPILYVSMKPSPSRWALYPKFQKANAQIERFLSRQEGAAYADITGTMLGKDGKPKPEIFVEDHLHMNADGYRLWVKVLEKMLVKTAS